MIMMILNWKSATLLAYHGYFNNLINLIFLWFLEKTFNPTERFSLVLGKRYVFHIYRIFSANDISQYSDVIDIMAASKYIKLLTCII